MSDLMTVLATLCAGLFTGACVYVSLVAHPVRLAGGAVAALAEFRPSFMRARRLQASLALLGGVSAAGAWLGEEGRGFLLVALLLFANVAFTFAAVAPVYERLLDPSLTAGAPETLPLLERWGRLHAVRTAVGLLAFAVALLALRAS